MAQAVSLVKQCDLVNWPLLRERLCRQNVKRPEEAVAQLYRSRGYRVSWCEGGSVKLLMKAVALPFLIENRLWFQSPEGVVSGFFESFCKSLQHKRIELLAAISNATNEEVIRGIRTICEHRLTREYFPRVTQEFVLDLWAVGGSEFVQRVAEVYTAKPYEYRAGWPDLTMLGEGGIHFREVKTSDRLLPSQLRFANEIARPLALQCAVVHVIWEPRDVPMRT